MPELQQPQLPPPPRRTTKAYRSPRAVNYNVDQEAEEGEVRWSDTSSESEERQNERATPRRRASVAENVRATVTRRRPRNRVTQRHHRPRPWDPGDNNEGHTDDPLWSTISHNDGPGGQAIPYGRDRPPRPGGDVYFAPPPGREHPNPFEPLNQHPPLPTHTRYGASHRQYHTNHHHISPGYHTNPFADPGLYHTPPYPPDPSPYPTNSYGASLYPAHSPTANTYPVDHDFYGPNPFTVNLPTIVPLYDGIPRALQSVNRKAHLIDPEVENLKRQIDKLEIRDRRREEKRREKEEAARRKRDEEERAKLRERRRREQEELKRQAESQSRRGMEPKTRPKRRPVDQEFDDEIPKGRLEKEVRAAMEYIAAGRSDGEIARRKDGIQDNRIDDMEHMLLAIKQFVEQRLQRQERPSLEERSVGTSLEGRRRNRLEVVPFEPGVDIITRAQIEHIVLDVLQRVGVGGQIQETAFAWDKSTVLSARPGQENRSATPPRPPNSAYGPRYNGELEARAGSQRHSSYESRQSDPITPDSQGQSSSHTAVNNSDQYSPLEIKEDFVRLRKPPGPRNGFERRNNMRASPPRVNTSAPADDYFPKEHDQAARGDGYRPANNHRGESRNEFGTSTRLDENGGPTTPTAAMGNGMTRRRSEMEPRRRKWRDTVVSDTDDRGYLSADESEEKDMFPRRSAQYSGKPPHGSRWHRVGGIRPPIVPDAPQGEESPKWAGRQATVVTDVDED
ncbi:uncharacterized protein PAC_16196 [Phialocephala subalpina]|uniref:Uncharacterized protein n=1 Tax=Phialocephala subalpina TaxID=576137 RepID=A0A1L7XMM5_9HELO|nr:uncharacterized protein PAC_16196 [Phialocephala subalpina]